MEQKLVYLGENAGTVGYTVGKSETEIAEAATSPEEQIDMLEQALAAAIQDCAQIQLKLDTTIQSYEHKIQNMVSADSEQQAPKFMKAIVEAMDFMNARQDYRAYQTLEHMKTEYGADYGYKEIDPLSPEALRLG